MHVDLQPEALSLLRYAICVYSVDSRSSAPSQQCFFSSNRPLSIETLFTLHKRYPCSGFCTQHDISPHFTTLPGCHCGLCSSPRPCMCQPKLKMLLKGRLLPNS
ncbi:hypothetical protein CRENBAI_000144 [Crenichthys baileyi]|uniref:Uncharacterized protein n=1 Tax=Crenichthys baileyi TaxID=28760 RepID=A0AAV9R1F5_9TELE